MSSSPSPTRDVTTVRPHPPPTGLALQHSLGLAATSAAATDAAAPRSSRPGEYMGLCPLWQTYSTTGLSWASG
eukprot:5672020-Pyramimonas_sp.AAC.1